MGKTADPAGAAPRFVNLEQRRKQVPESKSVKVRYGPYKVPDMKRKNILGEGGSLWNFADNSVQKPCDECTIIGMNAGLEYADGTNANIDTGLWLHHMVVMNIGVGREDATCSGNSFSLPHILLGTSPKMSERIFSSGNERTEAFLPDWNIKDVGYKLKKNDRFSLIVDLMNENLETALVYMTIYYDFVPGLPEHYDHMRPVWLDIAQCLTSEYPAPKQTGWFAVDAPQWTSTFDGEIIGLAGHTHDGGQAVLVTIDGKTACNSTATYGGKPEYYSKHAMHEGSATEHLSAMKVCAGENVGVKEVKKGQKWNLKAIYDYDRNKGDLHDSGKQANIMGIAIVFVREKKQDKRSTGAENVAIEAAPEYVSPVAEEVPVEEED
jgi:hypothetical protein